jgi:hypothetical protein
MAVFPELVTALAIPLNKTNIVDFLHNLEKHDLFNLVVKKKPVLNIFPDYLELSHSEYDEIFTDIYRDTGFLYIKDYNLFPECNSVYQSFNRYYIKLNTAKSTVPIKEINEISTKLTSLGVYQSTLDWSWYTFMDYVCI